jgi:hypothetical protein
MDRINGMPVQDLNDDDFTNTDGNGSPSGDGSIDATTMVHRINGMPVPGSNDVDG